MTSTTDTIEGAVQDRYAKGARQAVEDLCTVEADGDACATDGCC